MFCFPTSRQSPAAEITPQRLRPFTLIDQRKKLLLGITWLPWPSFAGVTRLQLPPAEHPAHILTWLIFSWEVLGAAWILSCFSHGRAVHNHLHITHTATTANFTLFSAQANRIMREHFTGFLS